MATFKKKDLNELVGGDFSAGGGDRNVVSNSEIETGPVQKPFNDDSDYERGTSTTSDRASRYRQDIPWFAIYSFGARRVGTNTNENTTKSVILKKNTVEEKIEDLVKKSKVTDVTKKDYDPKLDKILDSIEDSDFSQEQIMALSSAILNKAKKISDNDSDKKQL